MTNEDKYLERKYNVLVKDILDNKEFNKMGDIVHHGLDRRGHLLRVSYYSYKVCKLLGLNYESAARAGLLHDFFFENKKDSNLNERLITLVKHPDYAVKNASEYFELNDMEKNIISTHMFPVSLKVPKYAEGWIVNIVDDVVAVAEVGYGARNKLAYVFNFILILMFAYFK